MPSTTHLSVLLKRYGGTNPSLFEITRPAIPIWADASQISPVPELRALEPTFNLPTNRSASPSIHKRRPTSPPTILLSTLYPSQSFLSVFRLLFTIPTPVGSTLPSRQDDELSAEAAACVVTAVGCQMAAHRESASPTPPQASAHRVICQREAAASPLASDASRT